MAAKKKSSGTKAPKKKAAAKKKAAPKKKAAAKKKAVPKKKAPAKPKPAAKARPAVDNEKTAPAVVRRATAPKTAKTQTTPKNVDRPKGSVSSMEITRGHIFAIRPRVNTGFPQNDLFEAKRALADEVYASLGEAARAVAEEALSITRGTASRPEKHRRR